MKNFLIKAIAVSIIGSLFGGSLFYFWKNKYAFSKNQIIEEENSDNNKDKTDIAKKKDDKKIFDQKTEIINYLEKNINKISPEKPAGGSAWRLIKIWFIDDRNFYADYKDEMSNIRRALIFQSIAGPAAEYEILGFFVPGENGWILKSGKDIRGSISLKLYEKNKETGEWTAK